jgi:predicted SprT family Zn-dependent metalloprotease
MPLIRVSEARNGHTATLLATMAHEMCHLRQEMLGDRGHHTARFRRMAERVCRVHGFDIKTF